MSSSFAIVSKQKFFKLVLLYSKLLFRKFFLFRDNNGRKRKVARLVAQGHRRFSIITFLPSSSSFHKQNFSTAFSTFHFIVFIWFASRHFSFFILHFSSHFFFRPQSFSSMEHDGECNSLYNDDNYCKRERAM